MRVTAAGFSEWGAILGAVADRHCEGRSISVLEGGYNLEALPDLVEAYLAGLRKDLTRPSAASLRRTRRACGPWGRTS